MEKTDIMNQVIRLVTPYVKNAVALQQAGPETRILEDLGVNSARLVDIILDFEDTFKIAIDDQSADSVRSLGDAVQVIQSKLAC